MTGKVLFVDDEVRVLEGIQRNLRKLFDVHVAESGEAGLELIASQGPFPVVVSDMQMSRMNGTQFLSEVRDRWPDSVRILLTGHSDMHDAISAINEGSIFRFLTKPCPAKSLVKAVSAGMRQYRLIKTEKELLENTLKGSIRVLVDMLSLTNPAAFSRARRIRYYTTQVCEKMELDDAWQYEVAAMLSQLGCVTVPGETVEKSIAGEDLSEAEKEMIAGHPGVACELIANIPRLERVAEMVGNQKKKFRHYRRRDDWTEFPAALGGQILKAVIDFDALISGGALHQTAVNTLRKRQGGYNQSLLGILGSVKIPGVKTAIRLVRISDLRNGMTLAEDIRGKNNVLIVAKAQATNDVLRRRLENFAAQGWIGNNRVRVYVTRPAI